MKQNDLLAFTAIWLGISELYGKRPSDVAVGMAFRALHRLEINDIQRAFDAHVKNPDTGRFMPKPADIVRHIEGDAESRCLLAWTRVSDAMRHIGSYQSVVFDDPLVMCCITDMGGWIKLCSMREDELPFKRNEFVKRYRGYLNKAPKQHPIKLIGRIEQQNYIAYPEHVPAPVMIGDAHAAQAALKDESMPKQKHQKPGNSTAKKQRKIAGK